MSSPEIMRLMASSLSVASKAGSIIRSVLLGGKLGIIDKGLNDLQTQADRSAQHCIVTSLSKRFPGLCIIGEEDLDGSDQPFSEVIEEMDREVLSKTCPPELECVSFDDIVVWVDPLDGTSEFAKGFIEHVTVLIGVSIMGRAVGGVICQPFHVPGNPATDVSTRRPRPEETTSRLIWGLEGLGVFGLDSAGEGGVLPVTMAPPVFRPNAEAASGDNVILTTRSHLLPAVVAGIEACSPSKVCHVGGCGFKVIRLLEGHAHAYIFANSGCKRWDTCAPEALVNCLGGRLTGIDGVGYSYARDVNPLNRMGVLATPVAAWHSAYAERIPASLIHALQSTS